MANLDSGSANKAIFGRFAARSAVRISLTENLSEVLKRGVHGAIGSGLLVQWESRGKNFGRNLRDAIVAPFLIPVPTALPQCPKSGQSKLF